MESYLWPCDENDACIRRKPALDLADQPGWSDQCLEASLRHVGIASTGRNPRTSLGDMGRLGGQIDPSGAQRDGWPLAFMAPYGSNGAPSGRHL